VGFTCGRHRVARLMREAGIFGCQRRKFRPIGTTDSKHGLAPSPRVFQVERPETHPQAPNRVWVSDMTYVPTEEGWLYLTIQMDVFTRKIVGYAMSDDLGSEAVWESLKQALRRQPATWAGRGLVAHSDRGRQYASSQYRQNLALLGIASSMSRSGNCYDNAFAESFFHTLKVELTHRTRFQTREQARQAIEQYIDRWYNPSRLHSGLGYQTPEDYERQCLAA